MLDGADEAEIKRCKKIFSSFTSGDIACILNTLIRIKRASDVEVELMLLGYTGIRKPAEVERTDLKIKPNSISADIANETKVANESLRAKTTMTAEEEKDLVNKTLTTMDMDNILSVFDASVFTGDISDLK
jgi:hypothetical protein